MLGKELWRSEIVWGGLGMLLARGAQALGLLIIARALGPRPFGELSLVLSTILLIETLSVSGTAAALTRFVSVLSLGEGRRDAAVVRVGWTLCATFGLITSGSLALFASPVAEMLADPSLGQHLRLGAVYLFVCCTNAGARSILIGLGESYKLFLCNCAEAVSILLALVAAAELGGSLACLVGMVLAAAVAACALHGAAALGLRSRKLNVWAPVDAHHACMLWRFGRIATLSNVVWLPATWLSNAVLAHQPNGLAQLGLFGAAYQWFTIIVFFGQVVSTFSLRSVTLAASIASPQHALEKTRSIQLPILVIATILGLALIMAAPAVAAVYGPAFGGLTVVLPLLACAAVLCAASGPPLNLFLACGQPGHQAAANFIGAGVLLIGSILLAKGAVGLAIATLLAHTARLGASLLLVRRVSAQAAVSPSSAE